jgi:hypothetical protein
MNKLNKLKRRINMNKRFLFIAFAITMLVFSSLACEASASTATISSAKLASDNAGANETTTFTPDQTFYCIVTLANAPDTTKVKAVWSTVDDAGKATQIAEKEIVGSASPIVFNASNNAGPWPAGKYRVEIYLNDKVDKTLDFSVQ